MFNARKLDAAQFILHMPARASNSKGQREVQFPNCFNFRDVGGYRTENGRFLRWGQLYRSGTLAKMAHADHEIMHRLGIRTVFDLRSPAEVAKQPDRLPQPMPAYQHLPLVNHDGSVAQLRTLRRYRQRMDQMLLHIYTRVVLDQNAHHLGAILRRLAEPANRPALIHCAVGKDRTGVAVALLLALLGVPEETIVADYTLSNRHHPAILAEMRPEFWRATVWAWIRPSALYPLALAQPDTMRAALRHLRQQYGSAEEYARHAAAVDDATLASLRQQFLE